MAGLGPIGFSNPWKQISAGQKGFAGAEDEITRGILTDDPNSDPVAARHKMFRFAALIGQGRDREKEEVEKQRQRQLAEKDTFNPAKPA